MMIPGSTVRNLRRWFVVLLLVSVVVTVLLWNSKTLSSTGETTATAIRVEHHLDIDLRYEEYSDRRAAEEQITRIIIERRLQT